MFEQWLCKKVLRDFSLAVWLILWLSSILKLFFFYGDYWTKAYQITLVSGFGRLSLPYLSMCLTRHHFGYLNDVQFVYPLLFLLLLLSVWQWNYGQFYSIPCTNYDKLFDFRFIRRKGTFCLCLYLCTSRRLVGKYANEMDVFNSWGCWIMKALKLHRVQVEGKHLVWSERVCYLTFLTLKAAMRAQWETSLLFSSFTLLAGFEFSLFLSLSELRRPIQTALRR